MAFRLGLLDKPGNPARDRCICIITLFKGWEQGNPDAFNLVGEGDCENPVTPHPRRGHP